MGVSVSERVGELEGRLETCQQQIERRMDGLQVRMDSLKTEFLRMQGIEKSLVTMVEQFNLLVEKWGKQEGGERGNGARRMYWMTHPLLWEDCQHRGIIVARSEWSTELLGGKVVDVGGWRC